MRECVKSLKAFEQSGTTLNTDKSEARDPRHINPSKAARKTREEIGSKGLPAQGRKRTRHFAAMETLAGTARRRRRRVVHLVSIFK